MKMLYFGYMNDTTGYSMTEQDIETTMRFLESQQLLSTREDAIKYLEEKSTVAHLAAHKIVEDEQSGKIDPIKLKQD